MTEHERKRTADEEPTRFLVDAAGLEELFGPTACVYAPIIHSIIPKVFTVEYEFEEGEILKEKIQNGDHSPQEINRTIWREMLFKAHIVVAGSLFRTCRLLDAVVRENRASNVPGWASCTRALLEAMGDSSTGMEAIPLTLAKNHRFIRRCLSGKEGRLSGSSELEDRMIHFTHGRKLRPEEKKAAPQSHQAKLTGEYLTELGRNFGMSDALALYKELCEFSHPAAGSIAYFFSPVGDGHAFRIDPSRDRAKIDDVIDRYRGVFESLLMVAMNPILLSLKVFDQFDVIPKIPELREFNLGGIPAWRKIETLLNKR